MLQLQHEITTFIHIHMCVCVCAPVPKQVNEIKHLDFTLADALRNCETKTDMSEGMFRKKNQNEICKLKHIKRYLTFVPVCGGREGWVGECVRVKSHHTSVYWLVCNIVSFREYVTPV